VRSALKGNTACGTERFFQVNRRGRESRPRRHGNGVHVFLPIAKGTAHAQFANIELRLSEAMRQLATLGQRISRSRHVDLARPRRCANA
jgi:hypothetical protein